MGQKSGWSLLELLIVIAITTLLLGAGLQYSQLHVNRYRQEQAIHQLQQTLAFAKQAAIYHHQNVKVCAASLNGQCGRDWNKGLLVVLNGQPPSLLQQTPTIPVKDKIIWRGWLQHTYPQFESDGMPHSYHGSFLMCDKHHAVPMVVVNHVGRIRAVTDSKQQVQDNSC